MMIMATEIEIVTANFIMYRSCYTDFGFNKTDCERLGTGEEDDYLTEIESTVQPQASLNLMVQQLLNQVGPALICLLLGPWSDTHGRRPVLISTLLGFSCGGILLLIFVAIDTLSAWWLSIASIVIAAFGGITTFVMVVMCYISDISNEKNRGLRMGILEGMMIGGMLLGTATASYIFDAGGYMTVYILFLCCFAGAFLYHFFFMVESLQFSETQKIEVNLFSLKNIKEMIKTIFQPQQNYGRAVLVICVIMSVVVKFITEADASIYYYFLRLKLNWDMEKFTIFKSVTNILGILLAIGGIAVLHRLMKVREMVLIFATGLISVISMIPQGAAEEDWHIYLGGGLRAFAGMLSPLVRTMLSKLVNADDTGKVFALSSAIESIVLLCGLLGYTSFYGATKDTNPGAFNYITAALYGVVTLCAGCVLFIQKYYQNDAIFIMKDVEEKRTDVET